MIYYFHLLCCFHKCCNTAINVALSDNLCVFCLSLERCKYWVNLIGVGVVW